MRWLGLLFLALTLVACKEQGEEGKVVLHLANWGAAKEGNEHDKMVERIQREFERRNPGILIREESVPTDYVPKMSLAFVAGAQPDVMMLDASSAALFINSRMVADLTPLVKADREFKLDDFFPNVVNIARRGDALYAIPNDFTPMVVYYNKRMFDKAGVPYPKPGWDFEEFRSTAKRLTVAGDRPGDAPKQYGFSFTNWPAAWVMWLWNNGANHLSEEPRAGGFLDSEESLEAVAFLRDLIVKDGVAPTLSRTASLGVDLFANGQSEMAISGHWSMVGYANAPKGPDGKPVIGWDELGVVCLPHNTPKPQTVMYESGFAISAQSKHKEAAWKFIKYMTSREVQEQYQAGGIAVCGRRDVAEARAAKYPLEAQFIPIIPSARAPYGSRIEGYEYVEDQMMKAMDAVLKSGRSPAEAFGKAADRIDREFLKK
jgi:multiple sugar transport system substrate-binding protein